MNSVIQYFETIPSWHRALLIAGGISFFWLLESAIPLFQFDYNKWRHAGVNIFFTVTTLVINFFFALLVVFSSAWCLQNGFGLLQWIVMPVWLELIIGFLALDLVSAWLIHFIQHKVKWMWKFHMIHHSDTKVDVTTGTRHHPGEWLFREFSVIIGILILGIPVGYYFFYRSLSGFFTHFNHANIRVPPAIDKPISWIFVSPNMHKVHHHYKRPYTNSNYSNIFSLWDRMFGTFVYDDPKNLKYGLDVLDDKSDEDLSYQFKIPFDKTIKTDY